MRITYLGGVLPEKELMQLRRLLIRNSRGKVFVHARSFDVPEEDRLLDPKYEKFGNGDDLYVYVLAFEAGAFLTERVKRLTSCFRGEVFEVQIDSLYDDLNATIASREDV